MLRGSCLCGAVEFEVTGKTTPIGMCHCSQCRKVSGVASNANFVVGRDGLSWTRGEEQIRKFSLPSGWSVWRCSVCGSPLPMLHPGGGAYWVPAGLLDGDPGLHVAGHIWVGSKASWDEIAGSAPQLEEGFGSPSRSRTTRDFAFVDAGEVPWRPSTMAPQVEVKDLGSADGRSMQLVRYEAGARFPEHRHEGPEFVYVLEGELLHHGRRLGPGSASVAAAGSVDTDIRTESGCVFLTVYSD